MIFARHCGFSLISFISRGTRIAGGHVPLFIQLSGMAINDKGFKFDIPRPFRLLDAFKLSQDLLDHIAEAIIDDHHIEDFYADLGFNRFNDAWGKLNWIIDGFLDAIDNDRSDQRGQGKSSSLPSARPHRVVPQSDDFNLPLSAADSRSVSFARLRRRVAELVFKAKADGSSPPSLERCRLWENTVAHVHRLGAADLFAPTPFDSVEPPSLALSDVFLGKLDLLLASRSQDRRRHRIKDIKQALLSDYENSARACWRNIRPPRPPPCAVISNDGSVTADTSSMLAEAVRIWTPIFRKSSQADWETFRSRFKIEIDSITRPELDMPSLTGEDFRCRFRQLKAFSAPGTDGRTANELKVLPLCICDLIADFWNEFFLVPDAEWPVALTAAACYLIPKPNQVGHAQVKDLRPINVLPLIYRCWASIMLRKFCGPLFNVCPPEIRGCRPRVEAGDAALDVALGLEECELGLAGKQTCLAIDISKFFDSMSWQILSHLGAVIGLPSNFITYMLRFYAVMIRRLVVNGIVSEPILSLNGFPQGCALSSLWSTLGMLVWTLHIKRRVPEAAISIFVDDRVIRVFSEFDLLMALRLTEIHDKLAGLAINGDKSTLASSSRSIRKRMARLGVAGKQVKSSLFLNILGHTVSHCRRKVVLPTLKRHSTAHSSIKRIHRSLTPWAFKRNAIRAVALAQAHFGNGSSLPPISSLRKLRTEALKVLWGRGRHRRCPEIVFSIFQPGHQLDPVSNDIFQRITTMGRLLRRNESHCDRACLIVRKWLHRDVSKIPANWPIISIIKCLHSLGATIDDDVVIHHPVVASFSLVGPVASFIGHQVRDLIRYALWRDARERALKRSNNSRIADLADLPAMVDMVATRCFLTGPAGRSLSPDQSKALSTLLSSSLASFERLFRDREPLFPGGSPPDSATCPF
jgi:hypothetical protein